MTDLERMGYAVKYLLSLSDGINPLTGEKLPKEDIVNNSHIANCLKFSSEALRELYEAGGEIKKPHIKKCDFSIEEEVLEKFPFSKAPLTISDIADRINSLTDTENMKRCHAVMFTDWLLNKGFLKCVQDEEGKNTRLPTEAGTSIGLSSEKRSGMRGDYTIILYNLDAQHFIIDNFYSILDFRQAKKESKNEPWQDDEIRLLSDFIKSGKAIKEISALLNRPQRDIHKKIAELFKEKDRDIGDTLTRRFSLNEDEYMSPDIDDLSFDSENFIF